MTLTRVIVPPEQDDMLAYSSEDIKLHEGHILKARCRRHDGTVVDSSLDLDGLIGNNDGFFTWGGRDFSKTAQQVLLLEGHFLSAFMRKRDGLYRDRMLIDLHDRIKNVDGVLRCT